MILFGAEAVRVLVLRFEGLQFRVLVLGVGDSGDKPATKG